MDSGEGPIGAGIQQPPIFFGNYGPDIQGRIKQLEEENAKLTERLEARKKIYFQMLSDMTILCQHKNGETPENVRKLMLCSGCHEKDLKLKDKDIEIAHLKGHVMFLEGIMDYLKQSLGIKDPIPRPHVGTEAIVE